MGKPFSTFGARYVVIGVGYVERSAGVPSVTIEMVRRRCD